MKQRVFSIAVFVAILVALAIGGRLSSTREREPSPPVSHMTTGALPWWIASGRANAGPAAQSAGESGTAPGSAWEMDAGYGAPLPTGAALIGGPPDPLHVVSSMYCGRYPVGPGPEPGTLRDRLPDGYESVCTVDGLPIMITVDKAGGGVAAISRFVYAVDGIYEYYDEGGDGGLDALTLHKYDSQGRVVHSRTSTGFGRSHDTFERWELNAEETRRYEGLQVTVERWFDGVLVVQVWDGERLVSEESHEARNSEASPGSP